MNGILYLVLAIVFTATAQLLYKSYFKAHHLPYVVLALFFFVLTPVMAFLALKELPLSTVYMSTAMTYVLVVFGGKLFLGEDLSLRKIQALSLIVGGVICFNLGSG